LLLARLSHHPLLLCHHQLLPLLLLMPVLHQLLRSPCLGLRLTSSAASSLVMQRSTALPSVAGASVVHAAAAPAAGLTCAELR
jgi:hypothetical protein